MGARGVPFYERSWRAAGGRAGAIGRGERNFPAGREGPAATRVRYTVLGLLCLLAMITYLDRAAVANSKDTILAAVDRPASDWFCRRRL